MQLFGLVRMFDVAKLCYMRHTDASIADEKIEPLTIQKSDYLIVARDDRLWIID